MGSDKTIGTVSIFDNQYPDPVVESLITLS